MALSRLTRAVAKLLPLLALTLAPRQGAACGGLFCSSTSTPVDQTAEHILFTVNGDHTVTAYVQITYSGSPDKFAWIIPAPSAPRLSADFPELVFRTFDARTQPRYSTPCPNLSGGAGGGGTGGTGGFADAGGGVTVIEHQNVGPFETVTLEGTSAELLVEWLQKNDYRITDKMIPFIRPYVEGGMKFVAMRLLPDKETKDITPIAMTYDSDKPAIPLRLTTVAAQPEMSIIVYILADKRWGPDNYVDLQIPDDLIRFSNFGQSNYFEVISKEADKVGGQAFVTEYAQATNSETYQSPVGPPDSNEEKARRTIWDLFKRFPYLTRLYTRLSAEEMTEDPSFKAASNQAFVDNFHTPSANNCEPTAGLCAFAYCGREGACVTVSDNGIPRAACVCKPSATARVTATTGAPQIYCEPRSMDLNGLAAGDAGAAPLFDAACEGVDCGSNGVCLAKNGIPTCACRTGFAAVPDAPAPRCVPVRSIVPAFPVLPPIGQPNGGASGNGGTNSAGSNQDTNGSSGCNLSSGPSSAASLAAVLTAAWIACVERARRRRRRH